jgi:hypothetical protein
MCLEQVDKPVFVCINDSYHNPNIIPAVSGVSMGIGDG